MSTEALDARPAEMRGRILSRARATLEEALTLLDRADRNALPAPERQRVSIMIHALAESIGAAGLLEAARAAADLDRTIGPWLRGENQDRPLWKIPFKALAVALADAQQQ